MNMDCPFEEPAGSSVVKGTQWSRSENELQVKCCLNLELAVSTLGRSTCSLSTSNQFWDDRPSLPDFYQRYLWRVKEKIEGILSRIESRAPTFVSISFLEHFRFS